MPVRPRGGLSAFKTEFTMFKYETIKTHLSEAMTWAQSGTKLTYAAIGVGVVLALVLFRLFFKNLPGLMHCIGFSMSSQPNAVVGGQMGQSRGSRVKLILWALVPTGSGYAAYLQLPKLFPSVFH
jgi:hypothetical protein